ncbi:MAG: hypothetical protein U1E62_21840 [Alsobacter sp.]
MSTTLFASRRWLSIAVSAAMGAAIASLGLYLAFHHFGWVLLLRYYPDLVSTKVWSDVTRWLSTYGTAALFAIMALPVPVPKLPALAFAGIYRLPIMDVFFAILSGKLIKYTVYAAAAAFFPRHFRFLRNHSPGSLGAS